MEVKTRKVPNFEERLINELTKIHFEIGGLSRTIESLYNDWKFPVGTMAEQMEPQWKEQREENRLEKQLDLLRKQNKILIYTVIIAVLGVTITALAGVTDIILRLFLNK